jgi:hypothetical protein
VSCVRDRVRSITWPADVTYQHALYKEGAWVDLGNQSEVVAYRMTFDLIAALPYATYRDTSSLFS